MGNTYNKYSFSMGKDSLTMFSCLISCDNDNYVVDYFSLVLSHYYVLNGCIYLI